MWQLLEAHVRDLGSGQFQRPDRFAKEGRLSRLRLDQREGKRMGESASAGVPETRHPTPDRTRFLEIGMSSAAKSGSMNSRSNVASVGGCKGRAVRLIFTFHCASRRWYISSGASTSSGARTRSLASASRQTLPEFARRHAASLQPIRRQASNVRAQHRNRGRCHPGNPQRLSKRVRPDLCQPLNCLSREAGHAVKREARRYPTLFIP